MSQTSAAAGESAYRLDSPRSSLRSPASLGESRAETAYEFQKFYVQDFADRADVVESDMVDNLNMSLWRADRSARVTD